MNTKIGSLTLPQYTSSELMVRNKLKLNLTLTESDQAVIVMDVNQIANKIADVNGYLNTKYPKWNQDETLVKQVNDRLEEVEYGRTGVQ